MKAQRQEKYYADHEQSKELQRERYYEKLEWSRTYYKDNREKILEQHRAVRLTAKGRAQGIYNSANARARVKGFPCTITRKFVQDAIEKGFCPRTGIPFDLTPTNGLKQRNPFSPSIDKIDPSKGYTPENTQIVVWCYNTGKGEATDEEFISFCKCVAEYNP
jgi:hypothetical protein